LNNKKQIKNLVAKKQKLKQNSNQFLDCSLDFFKGLIASPILPDSKEAFFSPSRTFQVNPSTVLKCFFISLNTNDSSGMVPKDTVSSITIQDIISLLINRVLMLSTNYDNDPTKIIQNKINSLVRYMPPICNEQENNFLILFTSIINDLFPSERELITEEKIIHCFRKYFTNSMNELAFHYAQELAEQASDLAIKSYQQTNEPMIIDCGIETKGSYKAGLYASLISMGGLATGCLSTEEYDSEEYETIWITTNFPFEATLASQLAGWRINKEGYTAIGSGPARILAKKPKNLFQEFTISNYSKKGVLVLETNKQPTAKIIDYVSRKCSLHKKNLLFLLTPTTSFTGTTQISSRAIETAIHKLHQLGVNPRMITKAHGKAPIAPVIDDTALMMGRVNDMLIYGSEVILEFNCTQRKEESLIPVIKKAVSNTSPVYGELFYSIFEKAKGDFYAIDSSIFAPAKIITYNHQTNNKTIFGSINHQILKKSIDLT
jgi:methenyltetrahydromethanopterin cyclohydrolase